MLKFTSLTCLYLLLSSQTIFAQCSNMGSNLVAPYNSSTSNKGVMFDVTATNTLTIFCFDANLPLSHGIYSIYYKSGSYAGSETTPANWTLAGTSDSILSLGINTPTPINVPVYVVIPAGQTVAFYIGATDPASSTGFLTTTGTGFETIASNAELTISGGIGITYPFGTVTPNRNFNGTVYFAAGIVLPIEFMDFTATKMNQSVLLKWQTETENDSDYFEIERSSNGTNWKQLTTTEAAGESPTPKHYQEVDPEPLAGINYYRLNQYDLDGVRTILKSISFNNELKIGPNEIHVFPNPMTEKTSVFGDKSELEQLTVLNSIGQDISKNLTITSHNGYSNVSFENQEKGVFILKSKTMSQIIIKE